MKPPTIASWPMRWGVKRTRDREPQRAGSDGDLTDEMLLAGFGTGDQEASLAFVRRFQRAVYGAALVVIKDAGLAEDIAQQAFERAWVHAEQFDPCRGTVRSWLVTIARNLAVDTLRVRRPYPIEPQDLERFIGALTTTPEGQALHQETSTRLRRALSDLPEAQARAVVLSAVHGLTAAELAELEDIPLGTAKSRIRSALIKLRVTQLEDGAR